MSCKTCLGVKCPKCGANPKEQCIPEPDFPSRFPHKERIGIVHPKSRFASVG